MAFMLASEQMGCCHWSSPLLPALACSVSSQGGGMDDPGVLSKRAEYRAESREQRPHKEQMA
eukprot:8426037-Prorocentrum_lima.AAC.1